MFLRWLRSLFAPPPPPPPTAFDALAQTVQQARLEALRLAAYARAARRQVLDLEASAELWERRAAFAARIGQYELSSDAAALARADRERCDLAKAQRDEIAAQANDAEEVADAMLRALERHASIAVVMGAQIPCVEIDDLSSAQIATSEATEAEAMDGLTSALDRDWIDRQFTRLERGLNH